MMSGDDADRTRVRRRLLWVLLAAAGTAVFVRVACYEPTVLESCTACLREAPDHCATSTANTEIVRQPGFNAREDAWNAFGCEAKPYEPCRTRHPMDDFVFTCQTKTVDLPPDFSSNFARLSPR